MTWRRVAATVLALAAGLLAATPAAAHDLTVGVLALEERAPGRWELAWTAPVDAAAAPADVTFRLPDACTRDGRWVTCGAEALRGPIAFDGLHEPRMQVLVSVRDLDGEVTERLVTGEAPVADLAGAARRSLVTWVGIGVEHVLGGLDHLAFVVGMLLVVGWSPRRLAATVSAFTVAHSVTLALAALDVLRLPPLPVEATIAASVVLLAREALTPPPADDPVGVGATLTRSRPWVVAAGFGLVHGLGFAGALAEVGLPRDAIPLALGGFNVGIELGQIAVLVSAALVVRAGRAVRLAERARAPVAYVLGVVGAFWMIERTARIVAGG